VLTASTAFAVPEHTAYGQITTTVPEERSLAIETPKTPASKVKASTYVAAPVGDTEAIVRAYFADIPVMIQVARCESTFRHYLADGSVLRGVVDNADTGVMQINKRYHNRTATMLGLNLDDITDNMAYARHLYETQGLQPWNASRPCWGKTLAMNI
jgi:ketosteroid isomerase-like protein